MPLPRSRLRPLLVLLSSCSLTAVSAGVKPHSGRALSATNGTRAESPISLAVPVSATLDSHSGPASVGEIPPDASSTSSLSPSGHSAVAGSVLSASSDYTYPGFFGATQELTTQSSNLPTRQSTASRTSVGPTSVSSAARKSPPPAATSPTDSIVYGILTGTTGGNTPPSTLWQNFTGMGGDTTISIPSSSASGTGLPPPTNLTTSAITRSWTTITWLPSSSSLSASPSVCQPSDSERPGTTYSVIYTSTVTWLGDPNDYTPPFPALSTPTSCIPSKTPNEASATRMTSTSCRDLGCSTWTFVVEPSVPGHLTSTPIPLLTPAPSTSGAAMSSPNSPKVTVITTDKNPAVVYPDSNTADYGGPTTRVNDPRPADRTSSPGDVPQYNVQTNDQQQNPGGNSVKQTAAPPATVRIAPTGVIIDGITIADNPQNPEQTVTVDGNTFTVNPSLVVGAGATITRSPPGGVFVPAQTSTRVAGLDVAVSFSVVVIDGNAFTLGRSTTSTIKGQRVVIGPSGVQIGTQSLPITAAPAATNIVIVGSWLITAIGQSVVVIGGTTITYGPGVSQVTNVGGELVTVGPEAVTIHGTTIGGASMRATDTRYEIVGGVTVTEIGASLVVIQGTTFTVGPRAGTTTKVVGHETITLGPGGVSVSGGPTLPYPFGPTSTTTITPTVSPGATVARGTASETGTAQVGSVTGTVTAQDAGPALRSPVWLVEGFISCIAIGIWFLGI